MQESNPFLEKVQHKKRNYFIIVLQTVVIASSLGVILYLFVITPNQVDGVSMEKSFFNGELVLTNRLSQWIGNSELGKNLGLSYGRGDVIIFQKPGFKEVVKRIVGLPGEKIAIRDGFVYINNKKVVENYLPAATYTNGGDVVEDGAESVPIPEGMYFCLGDNREASEDSRFSEIGFIDREWMKGKVILRFWPLSAFSLISTGTYTFFE